MAAHTFFWVTPGRRYVCCFSPRASLGECVGKGVAPLCAIINFVEDSRVTWRARRSERLCTYAASYFLVTNFGCAITRMRLEVRPLRAARETAKGCVWKCIRRYKYPKGWHKDLLPPSLHPFSTRVRHARASAPSIVFNWTFFYGRAFCLS